MYIPSEERGSGGYKSRFRGQETKTGLSERIINLRGRAYIIRVLVVSFKTRNQFGNTATEPILNNTVIASITLRV